MTTSNAFTTSQAETEISLDLILAKAPALKRADQGYEIFPFPGESQQDTTVPNVHAGHHPSSAPPQTTSENGDPCTEELLQEQQELIEAMRFLLQQDISANAITVKHYWRVVTDLWDKLLELAPHEVPHGPAYAIVLSGLMERLMSSDPSICHKSIHLHRRNYAECLGMLLNDMAKGFVFMQQTGMEDDVYIVNKELHSEYLCHLISKLRWV